MHAITRNDGIEVDVIKSGIVKYNVCDKPARGKVLNKQYLIHWQNAKRLNLDFPLMRSEERYLGIAVVLILVFWLTTFKIQNSLSIGFSDIFMVGAGVAQGFRSLARSHFCKNNVGRVSLPPDGADMASPLTRIRRRFPLPEAAKSDWLEPRRRLLFESARR
jgi:hypothetical protein